MEREISFSFLGKCLKKCWYIMIIAALVVGLCVGIGANFLPKTYSSSVGFYINNTNTDIDYVNVNSLDASGQLVNNYVDLIKSDVVLEQIKDYLVENFPEKNYKDYSLSSLRGMISSSAKDNSALFTIKVSSKDRQVAYDVATAIQEVAPDAITGIVKDPTRTSQHYAEAAWAIINQISKEPPESFSVTITELGDEATLTSQIENLLNNHDIGVDTVSPCFSVTNYPTLDENADSPNVGRYTVLGVIAAALLVYVIFFIRGLVDTNVSTEDDIKRHIKRPVIGVIPSWESGSKSIKK